MTLPNIPIVNAGTLYVDGLQLNWLQTAPTGYVTGQTVLMQPGSCRDSSNVNDIMLPQALTYSTSPPSLYVPPPVPVTVAINGINVPVGSLIRGNALGANGVDVGTLASSTYLLANSMYAVYVIADSNSVKSFNLDIGGGPLNPEVIVNAVPAAGLLSLNYPGSASGISAPYLPFGYDMYRRVGWVSTDSALNIAGFWQYDMNDQERQYYWEQGAEVLAAGASATYVAVALNTNLAPAAGLPGIAVPPISTSVLFDVSMPGIGIANFLPYRSGTVPTYNGDVRFGNSAAAVSVGSVVVPSRLNFVTPANVPTVLYKVTASSVTLTVTGFVDYL